MPSIQIDNMACNSSRDDCSHPCYYAVNIEPVLWLYRVPLAGTLYCRE